MGSFGGGSNDDGGGVTAGCKCGFILYGFGVCVFFVETALATRPSNEIGESPRSIATSRCPSSSILDQDACWEQARCGAP